MALEISHEAHAETVDGKALHAPRRAFFQLLASALEQLTAAETRDDILRVLRIFARRLVNADGVTIVLREGDNCFYAHADSPDGPLWEGQRFPLISCISGWAMLKRRTAIVPDVFKDTRIPHEVYRPTFVHSLVMVPVGRREPVAAIGAYWATVRMPTKDEVAVLQTLARAAGGALERCKVDEQIRASEQRLRSVFANTMVGFGIASFDGRIVEVNARLGEMLGYAQDDMAGMSIVDLIEPGDRGVHHQLVNQLVSGAIGHFHLETRFLHKSGDVVWMSIYVWLMADVAGQSTHLAAAAIDITGAKETQERLAQVQRLDALGQLTGGIAHDFNNLLTVINGSAELLAEQLADHADLHELATVIQTAGEKGAALTSRLLTFARRQALAPQLIRPDAVIGNMQAMLRRALRNDVSLRVNLGCADGTTLADQMQLETAVLNLCLNARDAMPNGGQLTIETSEAILDQDAREDDAAGPAAARYVAITVRDTGTGMSARVRAHAFEPFFTTKPNGAGTGLGLSMAYGFAKQSNGDVSIDSAPGAGTTVTLYLPRVSGRPVAPGSAADACPDGSGEHILLVEDDEAVRNHVLLALRTLAYRVEVAENGAQARHLLATGPHFDLLLTDIMMPGSMNGFELAREARRIQPHLKVLFSTGHSGSADAMSAQEPGMRMLRKPYRRAELARKVREALYPAE